MDKKYLCKIKDKAIRDIEKQYECVIVFDKSSVQDQYIPKITCRQGVKDIIVGELKKLLIDLWKSSTPFVSEYSKLGQLLNLSSTDNEDSVNAARLAEENDCLLLTYKKKRLILNDANTFQD